MQQALAILLLMAIAVRVYSLIRGTLWIGYHGRDFARRFRGMQPSAQVDPEKLWRLYQDLEGDFLPFGVKSWRLKIAAHRSTGIAALLFSGLRLLWLYWLAGPVLTALLIWLVLGSEADGAIRYLELSASLLLVAGALALVAEAVVASGEGLPWSGSYHRWPKVTSRLRSEHPNQDFALAVGLGFVAVLPSLVATIMVAGVRFSAFVDYPSEAGVVDQLARAMSASLAAVGGESFQAANTTGQLVKVLIALVFVSYAVVLLGRLAGMAMSQDATRRRR
ncbi:hypothetical protein [Modestobacter italicus]|uniref:hypothetical protein n=1 Tax=Modestobacter italicus (strain DSM 44449 / CECT 9708 / BC 501) TaxID=2732864 RepID=UPI001C983885|nr:hypothetical protein [Modestobacter italicus]